MRAGKVVVISRVSGRAVAVLVRAAAAVGLVGAALGGAGAADGAVDAAVVGATEGAGVGAVVAGVLPPQAASRAVPTRPTAPHSSSLRVGGRRQVLRIIVSSSLRSSNYLMAGRPPGRPDRRE